MLKNIIFEDDHIIVVYKPAGIATQTARVGQRDMVSELKNYLSQKSEAGERKEPYLGVVHRLDQPVAGLLVFARSRQAAAELSRQITSSRMKKYYYAVVLGRPQKDQGRLENYLSKENGTNRSLVVEKDDPGARQAILEYQRIKTLMALEERAEEIRDDGGKCRYHIAYGTIRQVFSMEREVSLMKISLITGRHHQIRVQMAAAGMPLLGDSKYGSSESREFSRRAGCRDVALCAFGLEFNHPVTKKRLSFEKQPEGEIFHPFFEQ